MPVATFLMLGLSIVAALARPDARAPGGVPAWAVPYAAALGCGLIAGILQWQALIAIAVLAAACAGARRSADRGARAAALGVVVLLALALALHLVPGFANPLLHDRVRFTEDAVPFVQYLNFDKASAGLFLLLACRPATAARVEPRRAAGLTALTALATASLVLCAGWVLGIVGWAPKLPPLWAAFLATNLLFTCVAEEALFRGVVQARLRGLGGGSTAWCATAIAVSAVLFGAVHLGGGEQQAGLAVLVGLGCALTFQWTGRLEAAVFTHFAVNAAHFLLFTYPRLA